MPDSPGRVLPAVLARRTRDLRAAPARSGGRYVLYALSGNLRCRENHALLAAVTLANTLELPVLAAFELTEGYPFASDRHHRFMLEGARETLRSLRAMGVAAHAFVHRPGHREPATATLARDAALVICDDVPTRPYRNVRAALLDATADLAVPVAAVDASCLVPMRSVDGAYERAFAYRKATKPQRRDRLADVLPDTATVAPPYDAPLPVAPTDLDTWDLGDLTAACEIDHSVPPVPEFPGGETAADARWTAFRDAHLSGYAARRNDALDETGVSRLSPYLRHGMIAATRLAREAAARAGKGPDKFLDELLIWREMSWAYAFHVPDHDQPAAVVPDWARESLERRRLDARPALYGWETLARATTDDGLWNAAQAAYLRRGYLRNNLRMTWGKALLTWTDGADEAGALLVDLNNRYALDGGDPNSYQGLFWCLGAFDRPFEPEQPIFGVIRPRSTAIHARRLDISRFAAQQTRYPDGAALQVAVIGAGLAGLICARTLADHGADVTVLDKGRHPGGRLATRRLEAETFADHGAPWFDMADARLAPLRESWLASDRIAPWPAGENGGRVAAVASNRALAAHLAADLDVHIGVTVQELAQSQHLWRVVTADGVIGPFDRVVVAVPAPQAAELLAPVPELAEQARRAAYAPSLTAMLGFDAPLPDLPDTLANAGPIARAVRESAKPGRAGQGEIWVLHADPAWSAEHLEQDPQVSAAALREAFAERVGRSVTPRTVQGHRWRYAQVRTPLGVDALVRENAGIGACGDWCPGGGVAGALLSGSAMAGRIFASDPAIRERGRPVR